MPGKRTPRSRLRIAIVIAFVGCVTGLGMNWLIVETLDQTRVEVTDRAAAARLQAEHLDAAFNARIANARGYLLTGDPSFLRARALARAEFTATLLEIRAHHPSLMAQLAPIDDLLPEMAALSDQVVALRDTDRAAAIAEWEHQVHPLQIEAHAIIRSTIAAAESEQARAHTTVAGAARRVRLMLAVRAVAAFAALALMLLLLWRSHRAQIRGALADQERDLLQILEHVPVGLVVRSPDGAPYYANLQARALLGKPDAEGRYQVFEAGTDLPYPMDRAPMNRALGEGIATEVSDMEIRRDGDLVPLHVRGGAVRHADGKIAFGVVAFQDVRELHRHAMRDALTGLANRASAQQTFRRDARVASRGGRALSVALIDLDHFKSINDVHGHAMGDHVLQTVAATLVGTLRAADVVARWGGEELVVILPDCDLAAARAAIERCLDAVRAHTFFGATPFEVTFSAGVALTRKGESLDAVVSRADAALYKAKRTGRCRVLDETARATGILQLVPASA